MTTNVPTVTFGANGFEAPSQEDVLAGTLADLDAAFGGNLNPALDTPQGQIASSNAAIIGEVNDTFVDIVNQVDPAYASGRMQDAIARIYFLERNPSQPTVVQAACSGLAGVVIPEGAIARGTDGNLYDCTQEGTIAVTGTVTLPFSCRVPGPIACPADSLNEIYQAIPGWDSINNPSVGVIGADTESRSAFEARRVLSVALNARGSLPSILAAVLAVPGVLDAHAIENDTNAPISVGGVAVIANSIYVTVAGGDEDDVALAIWSKKAPGCSYNGNTTVTVTDSNSGYSPPLPTYQVKFETPTSLPILFAVSIVNSAQVPSDAEAQIQAAIIAAFAGSDGGARARIGSTIYASRFYASVAALGSWVQLISLLVGSTNNAKASFTASIAGTNMTVSAVASGTLAPGQTVTDALGNVAVGTTIVSQTSGSTGSTGVYVVSDSQTVSSQAMQTVLPDRTSLSVLINQVPTVSDDTIVVTIV